MPQRVFISHAHNDRALVEEQIVALLRANDIDIWYASDDVATAAEWERAIQEGLEGSDWVIVVMSPRSLASKWVRAEVLWAMEERQGRVIPVLIEECRWWEFHLMIRGIQSIDFRGNLLEAQRRLLAIWDVEPVDRNDFSNMAASGMSGDFEEINAVRPLDRISNSIGMALVLVPPGEFLMGAPPAEARRADEEYQHRVLITRPYWIGVHQVTQLEYSRVLSEYPSYFSKQGRGAERVCGLSTEAFPVENVSWEDAVEFCARLSADPSELARGITYRLPTEAEWENACRASTTTPFSFGARLTGMESNCDGTQPYGTSTNGPSLGRTAEVGSYGANDFGLHDMHGNVWEWCHDWYCVNAYKRSRLRDPRGPSTGSCRVLRGGGWNSAARFCRSACREWYSPSRRFSHSGFRVAASASSISSSPHPVLNSSSA